MKNDSSRSVILCPFNSQTGEKTAATIKRQAQGLMLEKDFVIRFHPRVRELDRKYEKLNNQDFDNGVYHKYAYKQKKGDKKGAAADATEEGQAADSNPSSPVRIQLRHQNVDVNYHNHYIKINQDMIDDTARLGFPAEYITKCLKENATNHCTTSYYLACMDQNF